MTIGQCKFCGLTREFAEAHIVPKTFYGLKEGPGPLYVYSNSRRRPVRSPIGIYDDNLICLVCESKYAYLDSYAAEKLKPWPKRSQLLRDKSGFILKLPGRSAAGYWLRDFDANRLGLFFCFLTLRCALTNRREFSINAPKEIIAKLEQALLYGDASKADLHIIGSRFSDSECRPVYSPWPRSVSGLKPLNFVIYGLRFLVHFQPLDDTQELSLGASYEWPIVFDDFKGSQLHKVTVGMVGKHPDPWSGQRTRGLVA